MAVRRPPPLAEVNRLRIAFHASVWGSLAICAAIHLAAPMFADDDFLRLVLVIVFFASLASATWAFSGPYEAYRAALLRWRYARGGPSVQHIVERCLIRQARYARGLSAVSTFAVACIGLAVLSEWPLFLPIAGFQEAFAWAGILGLAGVPAYALIGSGQLREALALRSQLREEAAIAGVAERTAESEALERGRAAEPPVTVTAPLQFRAGGYDWRWSDFYKNAAVFGQSGTGKTVCVLNALLDGLIGSASALPASGLILDPKEDFRDKIDLLCRRHGRAKDLLVIDPDAPGRSMRWNPLDSEDDAQEIAGRFAAVMQIVNPAGGDDAFWIDSSRTLVQNLITLIRLARPEAPPSLVELYEAAMSDASLDRWGAMLDPAAFDGSRTASRARAYFFDVWKKMPDDTRATVRTFVANMLGSFLVEPYDELFSGRSDATIGEAIESGRILYVHMPIADREVMARVVSTFVKLEFYREVLRRPNKPRPSFFLCDEFQAFFTVGQGRGDADAFERTRQSNHANVIAFQNLNALLKQTPRREPVFNLLGNCAVKLFLRNTDKETNEYASELFGEQIETLSSSSVTIAAGSRGAGGGSVSGSAQYSARVKKEEFTRLAVPSREEGIAHAEVIAHLAARSVIETERMTWKVHPITQG